MHLDHFLQLSGWQQHERYEAPVVVVVRCTAQIENSFMQSEYCPAVDESPALLFYSIA
jgi:hypothetical protein